MDKIVKKPSPSFCHTLQKTLAYHSGCTVLNRICFTSGADCICVYLRITEVELEKKGKRSIKVC
jgi:hypothetical protein